MKKISFAICIGLCVYGWTACVNDKKEAPPVSGKGAPSPKILDPSVRIYAEGGSKYVLLDTIRFKIPDTATIPADRLFNGIYEFRSDSLKRRYFLITEKLAFLTTFEDLGTGYRGYLHVFDRASKTLIRDRDLDNDYLYSSAGIFVIDADGKNIFSVNKPEWYDAKEEPIVAASIVEVKGGYFKYIKNVYMPGNDTPGDTSLLSFYKNSLSEKSNKVYLLPEGWWKVKDPPVKRAR